MNKTDTNRIDHRKEMSDCKSPELMSISELSDAYGRLSSELQLSKDSFLSETGEAVRIVEDLSSQTELWRTKAELMSIEDSLDKLDRQSVNSILSYLYDLMFYGQRKVRRAAATAAGNIIAHVCSEDISAWSEYLHKILFMKPDRPSEKGGLSEDPLRVIFLIVYKKVPENMKKTVLGNYASYFKSTRWDPWTSLRLISGIFTIPVKEWGAMQRGNIGGFIRYFLRKDKNDEVRIASLFLLNEWLDQGWRPSEDFAGFLIQSFRELYDDPDVQITPADNVLIRQICSCIGTENEISFMGTPDDNVLFSDNLRSDQSWVFKLVNLRILKHRHMDPASDIDGFSAYVAHLMILLRINPDEMVFQRAGEDILDVSQRISDRQKYEMAKDLIKVLEIGYDETGYIPDFLGRFFIRLDDQSRSELTEDIRDLAASSDRNAFGSMLETVCCMLRVMSEKPDKENSTKLFGRLCAIVSYGLYSDDPDMIARTLFHIGCDLFAAPEKYEADPYDERNECCAELVRDTFICMKSSITPDIICHSLPVRHISSYIRKLGGVYAEENRPVAFFSSSFDPFSNGHRAVAGEIAEMGFQVFVNVHNFAWNRNMQPLKIRRQIAAMSVTDISHVRMFPEEISINTENPADLACLRSLFPGREVWLVMGSDRVENDEYYQRPAFEGSVHTFPHIIFVRNEASGFFDIDDIRDRITGECITLKLPVYYEHMTSREIRENIQKGKSIEGLVGRQIRNYIEKHNLYYDNRFFKPDLVMEPVETETDEDSCRIYLIKDGNRVNAGSVTYRSIINKNGVKGIEIVNADPGDVPWMYKEILLDETMMALQTKCSTFCSCSTDVFDEDMLRRRGFLPENEGDVFKVLMDRPVLLFTDVTSFISDDLDAQRSIMHVAGENARRLQKAVANLFPGGLVLTVISELLNYRLSRKIRSVCVPEGDEKICVPFGKILKYVSIPEVITMPLNTEKRYDPELENFMITEKSGYPSLSAQIRTIRSKNMPFVLVDDLYHKGYRMDRISSSLREEGIKEACLVVGAMSDKGRKLAEEKEIKVETIYYIPNLRVWINASDMIPFYGTDKIDPGKASAGSVLNDYPSIYTMLPYQFPAYLKEATFDAVYALSLTCMENAIRLFEVLESSYQSRYHRTLTFARLSEVIDEKGYPEEMTDAELLSNKPVSELLKGELLRLKRLK